MSRNYKFHKPEAAYFVSFAVVEWEGYTIVKAIQENAKESRRENLLSIFKKAADKSSNVTNYQFWRHDNKPIELFSNKVIFQKINYIHQNPVEDTSTCSASSIIGRRI